MTFLSLFNYQTDTRKGLDEQKTNNVLLFHIKDSIEAELSKLCLKTTSAVLRTVICCS